MKMPQVVVAVISGQYRQERAGFQRQPLIKNIKLNIYFTNSHLYRLIGNFYLHLFFVTPVLRLTFSNPEIMVKISIFRAECALN